ncbi:MAG: Malate dehydrogenase (oxaloacetate-decarboxylating), partial [Bryobacterales bacterium]|nr:Malate dehydrogenase (oxaloacetate-decarboxylating) [Bryobacterales bacterium]
MAHRIDATVQSMEPPRPDPSFDATLVDSRCDQLLIGDDAVLPTRDQRQPRFGRGCLFSHTENKSPRPLPSPPSIGPRAESDSIAGMPVSAQYSVTIRVELDARQEPLGKLTAAIAEAGGQLQGVDLVPGAGPEGKRVREFTIDASDQAHWERILRAIGSTRGARVLDYVDRTMQMHRGGKIEQHNKYPLKTRDDLSMAYTPGVARVCMDIHADRSKAFEYTIKKNTVAVVSDGSAVLGLGNIGPEAAMPVMEGK